ncbi:MAG: hypothetical protein AAGB05_12860 [Pseudomonadota bacterium]
MTLELPSNLFLTIVVHPGPEPAEIASFVRSTLVEDPRFVPWYWQALSEVGEDDGEREGAPTLSDLVMLGDDLEDGYLVQGKPTGLTIEPVEEDMAEDFMTSFGAEEGWLLHTRTVTAGLPKEEGALLETMAFHADLLRAAVRQLPVHRAALRRVAQGSIGPFPPLARADTLVDVLSMAEIRRDYADPQDFLRVWDRVDDTDAGGVVVERGLTIADELAWKRRSLDDGMTLARAAQPGLTRWTGRRPTQREQAMLEEAESFITPLGYNAQTKTVEFTAVVPADAHLPPIDLFTLQDWLGANVENAGKVERVVVTFPDLAAAEREAQPLREIGVVIQFYADDASVQPLVD